MCGSSILGRCSPKSIGKPVLQRGVVFHVLMSSVLCLEVKKIVEVVAVVVLWGGILHPFNLLLDIADDVH